MIHQLKIEKKYFEDVLSGKKTFEYRHNDRDFKEGDFLALNEYDGEACEVKKHTGCSCIVVIDYILSDERFVPPGFVILGIKPCSLECEVERDRVPCIYNGYAQTVL